MEWIDIACIVFVCVTMNHLGLIGAVENVIGKRIPIVNCSKCASWWFTLVYTFAIGLRENESLLNEILSVLAISFLASYAAIWLELAEGFIDTLYEKLYEKVYPDTADNADSADCGEGGADSAMPELRQIADK